MKIVYVTDSIYPYNKGGKEKRLFELSTRLVENGHDVHIYTMHWWKDKSNEISENGIQLHAISKQYEMYKGDRRSIKEGILFGLACFKLLRVKFDILDVDHMPYFPVISTWIVCKLRRRTLYGTWHEALSREDWISYMGLSGNVAALIERTCVKLPSVITAASGQTKDLLQNEHRRKKRVELVESGVNFNKMKQVKPKPESCDVLYVGRLVKDKNIDTLVRSIAIAARKIPSINCVVIGSGTEEQNITALIEELHLTKNITLLNPLEDAEDVYAYMKGAKVFILPSVREGFGIVALESLACDTPVITIDAPANAAKDLIKNRQMGSVVPLDAQNLADQISLWIVKKSDLEISQFVAEFDWDTLVAKQIGVYAS